jgi:hypothetical protein
VAKKNSRRTSSRSSAANGPLAVLRERVAGLAAAFRGWLTASDLTGWAERIAWVVIVVGLAVAWTVGVPRLEYRVGREAIAGSVQVRLLDPPAWLSPEQVAEIEREAGRSLLGDPFDRRELLAVADVVTGSGWFERVDQARRREAGGIEVRATPLVPFALIRGTGRDHLIDVTGRVLPHELPPTAERGRDHRDGLVVITGVRSPRPRGMAARWEGPEVRAALMLLELLQRRPWQDQVAEIDASRFLASGSLDFVTDRGSIFKWGSPPGAERPMEPTAARKLEMLDSQHAAHPSGRIDRGEDLQWWFYDDALTAERKGG